MADLNYKPKVYRKQGGNEQVVASGGKITVESGGDLDMKTGSKMLANGTQGAALTAQDTTITHTAPGTADFAIQALTTTAPFGFVTADEGHTVLKVIANLQARLAEVEARLEAAGIVAAN